MTWIVQLNLLLKAKVAGDSFGFETCGYTLKTDYIEDAATCISGPPKGV
jgi:hypothetical protein